MLLIAFKILYERLHALQVALWIGFDLFGAWTDLGKAMRVLILLVVFDCVAPQSDEGLSSRFCALLVHSNLKKRITEAFSCELHWVLRVKRKAHKFTPVDVQLLRVLAL